MSRFSMSHLPDDALLRELPRLVASERTSTAAMLAALAEVDARRLYAPLRHASVFLYCVGELKLSPDVAAKRIQAARAAREFPALLDAVEDGRLTVSALVLLAPHLTAGNLENLVETAAGRTCSDLRRILAHRFAGAASGPIALSLDAADPGASAAADVMGESQEQDSNPVAPSNGHDSVLAMEPLASPAVPPAPAPVRFPLHASVTQATREKLAYARALLGHSVPDGDVAEVLDRALDALIEKVEKQRFGVGARTRTVRRRAPASERTVPMAIRREVFRRDGGRCTFVGDTGRRCESCHGLEFDHVVPIARGGLTTADNLRLRCRTQNRLEAERVFGAAFVSAKRARAAVAPPEPAWHRDVVAALRALGFREREARGALPACELGPDATLEQRVRAALQHLAPPATRRPAPAA